MASESVFIHIIISLSILLFSAKIFAEMFQRINQPVVLGEGRTAEEIKSELRHDQDLILFGEISEL